MRQLVWNCWQRLLHKLAMVLPGGYSIRPSLHRLRGVRIGRNVWISQYVYIDEIHPEAVSIGNNCSIGLRTSIFAHLYWGPRRPTKFASPVEIEDDVFIGPHCVILPNVRIGRGSVVPAGTVVSQPIPPMTLWASPRARPIAKVTVPLTPEHSYEEFARGLRPFVRKDIDQDGPS